jgi:hypothetical protein
MPKFIVYEIWTRAVVVEGQSEDQVLSDYDASPPDEDLSLSNWHAVEVHNDAAFGVENGHRPATLARSIG